MNTRAGSPAFKVADMQSCDQQKTREITFTALPAFQTRSALMVLQGLQGLRTESGHGPNNLVVHYDVCDYTLENLEAALLAQGFHLDNGLLHKLRRALIYFCERNQRGNLNALPSQQKSVKPFVEAFQHHPHGDRDDTPEEWRTYK